MASLPSYLSAHRKSIHGKQGQTLVEYALIMTFISVVAVGVLAAMGTNVKGTFSTVNSQLSNVNSAASGTGGSGSGSGSSGGSGGSSGGSSGGGRSS